MSAVLSPSLVSSPAAPPLLDVRDLVVRFDAMTGGFDVVRHVSFSLEAGRTLCLVGESGSGKSMTALALLRLIPPPGRIAGGSVLLAGEDLATLGEAEMRRIRGGRVGMIFQEPMTSLNPVLRVGDQAAEPLIWHWKLPRRQALERVEDLFRQVGIPAPRARLREYPHQLSGGMRQRVMIAMALACEPAVLLADEPTTALDVTIQGQILALLKRLSAERGLGLVLITHDLGVVAETADEVCVMYAGGIVERASAADLFARPLHPYTEGLMRCAPALDDPGKSDATENGTPRVRLDAIPGAPPSADALPDGCPFRPRCRSAHERCLDPPPDVTIQGGRGPRRVRCWLHAPSA